MSSRRRSKPSKLPRSKFGRRMRIALELAAVLAAILLIVVTRDWAKERRVQSSPNAATGRESVRAEGAKAGADASKQEDAAAQAKVKANLRNKMLAMPLRFERNEGQFDGDVRYIARSEGITLALADDGPTLRLGGRPIREAMPEPGAGDDAAPAIPKVTGYEPVHELHMRVEGAAAHPKLEASEELETKTNYFIGNDPSRWRSNVSNYGRVTYREILPGIDLVYRGDGSKLEYDFVVAPGASPGDIAVSYEGADGLSANERGELEIALAESKLVQHKPFIYQEIDGERRRVDGSFRLLGGVKAGFDVGEYDRTRPLVIDPVVIFASYLGGTGTDYAYDVAFDSAGRPIVTGEANGPFPLQAPYDNTQGGTDVFVSKFSADGSSLVFSTYLGGGEGEVGYAVEVDSTGAIVVAGYTASTDFPLASAAQATRGGSQDGFITKLNSGGSALVFSTYLGGDSTDNLFGLAVDSSNAIYSVGFTNSLDFPATGSAYQTVLVAGSDAIVAKYSSAGSKEYATYFGGTSSDIAYAVAVRSNGNAVIVGRTTGTITTTEGVQQPNKLGGSADAFVMELNAAGAALVFSTYLGGSLDEAVVFNSMGLALDGSGDIYVAGITQSTDFPVTTGAFQTSRTGGLYDAYLSKLSANGTSLVYSTYLGGIGDDRASDVAVDSLKRAFVTGITNSGNFPTQDPTQPTHAGSWDFFVTVVNPAGNSLAFSTYWGGPSPDLPTALDIDASGRVVAAGYCAPGSPMTAGAYQTVQGAFGSFDACLAVFSLLSVVPSAPKLVLNDSLDFDVVGSEGPFTWALTTNNSGATFNPTTAEYTAGTTTGTTDVVTVTNTETGETATATIQVFAPLTIDPTSTSLVTGTSTTFMTTGGTGSSTFSIPVNNSGATIDASTGQYTAGATTAVTDTVRVTDDTGHTAEATVSVTVPDECPENPDKAEAGDCGCDEPDIDADGDEVTDCIDLCIGNNASGDDDKDGVCNDSDDRPVITSEQFSGARGPCEDGGVEIVTGIDTDGDGELTGPEIAGTSYACSASDGMSFAVSSTSLDPNPAVCPTGGVQLVFGVDDNGNGQLDEGEDGVPHTLCAGTNALTNVVPLAPDPLVCPAGGVMVQVGLDENGNLTLDDGGEVFATEELCNASQTVSRSSAIVPDPESELCPNGGVRIELGLDDDNDTTLDDEEVETTANVCRGLNTLASSSPVLPSAEGCPTGGFRIAFGVDTNGNGTLEEAEENTANEVCHGRNTLTTVSTIDPNPEVCPNGGVRIDVGLDENGDGMLDVETEVAGNQEVCHGLHSLTRVSELEPNAELCPNGGTRIEVGLDLNGDGVLGDDEVDEANAASVCHGRRSVTTTTPLPEDDEFCVNGGLLVESGLDANGNGTLDPNEVDDSERVCNGAASLTTITELDPNPEVCPNGGVRADSGLDLNGSGSLEEGEITESGELCHGRDSLTVTTALDPNPEICPNGGVRVDTGLDINGSGVLDEDEITSSEELCHGRDSLTVTTELDPNPEICPNGGARIDTGLDINGSGVLDEGEITSSEELCHGRDSLTVTTVLDPNPEICPNGGARIDTGLDINGDEILDEDEISSSEELCHGRDSLTVTTDLEPNPEVCPRGGSHIDTGLDINGNGILDEEEITSREDVCHGDNSLVTNTPLEPNAEECAEGGARIDVGLDGNGNLTLDEDEIQGTATLCSGLHALVETSVLEPDAEVCPKGGILITAGVDENGNGVLGGDEVSTTQEICDGLDSHVAIRTVDPGIPPLDENEAYCPNGGIQVFVGRDSDGSNELDFDEVDANQVVCNGLQTLIATTSLEPNPEICVEGGWLIHAGLDADGNGELDEAEVSSTQEICHGLNGLIETTAVEPHPETCPTGGVLVATGLDENGSGALDENEVTSSLRVCTGLGTLVSTALLEPNPEVCPAGGTVIAGGVDANGDAVLEAEEVTATQNICHGLGSVVETTVLEPNPEGCRSGGIAVRSGVDADGNGALNDEEPSEWREICHGEELLARIDSVERGATCPTGGIRLHFGYDGNANGVLSDDEIKTSQVLCHGRIPLTRTAEVEPDPELCAAGGTRLESGVDDNGNGMLDDDEVDFMQLICDGTDAIVRKSLLEPDVDVCPKGGTRIEAGTDKNGNGSLDDDELQTTSTVCGGSDSVVETRRIEPGDVCESGGLRIIAGRDDGDPSGTAADGRLQEGEIDSSYDLCDDVVVSGASGDCTVTHPGERGAMSLALLALALGLALTRVRRRVRR